MTVVPDGGSCDLDAGADAQEPANKARIRSRELRSLAPEANVLRTTS